MKGCISHIIPSFDEQKKFSDFDPLQTLKVYLISKQIMSISNCI